MTSDPLRDSVAGFAGTEYVTVPGPLPLPPLVSVIHDPVTAAVHAQPAATATATLPVPPSEANAALADEIA